MPCTSFEDVHVICLVSGGRGSASTGGGWRRTCAWRERRWPSFISWRWVGPAQAGWIRCRWRTPPLRLPPPDLHPSMTSMSPPRLAPVQPRGRRAPGRVPRRAVPASRPSAPSEPRSQRERAPGRRPSEAAGRRLGNQPVRVPGSPPKRARGSGPRRAAGGADGRLALVLQAGEGCRAVDQCNMGKGLREVPQKLPGGWIDLFRIETDVIGVA